ncbi:hypothetical protein [Maize yellow stripe virus]|nr:hypothetical protein [Maize yellow stripe virus]
MELSHTEPNYGSAIVVIMSFLNSIYNENHPSEENVYLPMEYSQICARAGFRDWAPISELIELYSSMDNREQAKHFYKNVLQSIFNKVTIMFTQETELEFPRDTFNQFIKLTELYKAK